MSSAPEHSAGTLFSLSLGLPAVVPVPLLPEALPLSAASVCSVSGSLSAGGVFSANVLLSTAGTLSPIRLSGTVVVVCVGEKYCSYT